MTETPKERKEKVGQVSVAARRYALLDVAYLRERFEIAPGGVLVWRSGRQAGCEAGSRWRDGYVWIGLVVDGTVRRIKRGRLVYALTRGQWPELEIDHINRDRADDRPENLREATRAENNQNRRAYRKASGLPRGVYRRRGAFESAIGLGSARIYLGRFQTPELASQAYEAARAQAYGAFA